MKPSVQFRQRAVYPLWRRVRDQLASMITGQPRESQPLYLVTINGRQFKRLILPDTYRAMRIEQVLRSFGTSTYLPQLVGRYVNDIWIEYVDGMRMSRVDVRFVRLVADLYREIYTRRPYTVETSSSRFLGQLEEDLGFLNKIGLLKEADHSKLRAAAAQLMPDRIWLGFDYIDPLLKNLILVSNGERLCAVDVESLVEEGLIGYGVAKACASWLGQHRSLFFECLADMDVPDFASYFPFVELVFLARWTKRNVLKKKWKLIDMPAFDGFCKDWVR